MQRIINSEDIDWTGGNQSIGVYKLIQNEKGAWYFLVEINIEVRINDQVFISKKTYKVPATKFLLTGN